MDAPKCRLCDKKHYGLCQDAVVPSEPRVRKSKAKSKGKPDTLVVDARNSHSKMTEQIAECLGRIESLEARVGELEARKKYMKKYMAEKRANG